MWVVGVIAFGISSSAMGGAFGQDFTPSGFESTHGLDVLEEETGGFGAGLPGTIVFRAEQGVDDPEVEARMTELFTTVQAIADDPDVDLDTFDWLSDEQRAALDAADLEAWEGVTLASPYEPTPEPQIATEGPEAGKIAFASFEVPTHRLVGRVADRRPAAGALPRDRRGAGRARRWRASVSSRSPSPRRSDWPSPSSSSSWPSAPSSRWAFPSAWRWPGSSSAR